MKRMVSILLVVALVTTGCSLIGKREAIIPEKVQGASSDSVADTAEALSKDASAAEIDSNENSLNNKSSVSSSEISNTVNTVVVNSSLIDNATGEGVITTADNKNNVLLTLYYKDKKGLLIPVSRTVQKQEGLAKVAINGLVDNISTREQLDYYGLYPVLPKGTKIKGMNIKNGNAVIDFSKEFLNQKSVQEGQRAVAAVVYTLTGFKTISNVTFRVEGKELKSLTNGISLSEPRDRNNTFINAEETAIEDGYVKFDLYYTSYGNDKLNYLVPVSKKIENSEVGKLLQGVFNELALSKEKDRYFTSFPEGTKLLSGKVNGNEAVLDFSSQIKNYGGNAKENNMLNQIYCTVNQLSGVQKVKILVDGKETTMPEGSEVAYGKNLPVAINKVIEN